MSPVDYGLCRQTVTVYRATGEGYERTVYPKAFFSHRRSRSVRVNRNRTVDSIGAQESSGVLVVIPGEQQTLFPGDKVLPGEGPQITDRAAWAAFIPSRVPGLAILAWAEPMYWNGKIVHTEAGT